MSFNTTHHNLFFHGLFLLLAILCNSVQADITQAIPIEVGETAVGYWAVGDELSKHHAKTYAKYYELTIDSQQEITIDVGANDIDEMVFLLKESGKKMAQAHGRHTKSSGEKNARITRRLSPGTYFLEVTNKRGGTIGSFTVSVSSESTIAPVVPMIPVPDAPIIPVPDVPVVPVPDAPVVPVIPVPNVPEEPTGKTLKQAIPLEIGNTVHGYWTIGDNLSRNHAKTYTKFYQFTIDSQQEINIDVGSDGIDEIIFLLSESGKKIAQAHGRTSKTYGEQDALITRKLRSGTYILEVTNRRSGTVGGFTISISSDQTVIPDVPVVPVPDAPVVPATPVPDVPVVPVDTPPVRNTYNMIDIGFEQPDLISNGLNPSGNPPQLVSGLHPVYEGNQSLSIFIDRAHSPVEYRTEFTLRGEMYDKKFTEFEYGQEYWIGFAIYLNDDYQMPEMSDIIFQTHGKPDLHLGEGYRNPILSMAVSGLQEDSTPHWRISINGDDRQITPGSGLRYPTHERAFLSPVQGDIGRWVSWVIHFKHTYNADGYIDIWKDGKQVYSKNGIRTAFNDVRGSYLKMGSYKWSWRAKHNYPTIHPAKRQSYLDSLRIAQGQNRYDDVAP